MDREEDPEFDGGKRAHFDIRGTCSDGTTVEVEFQNGRYDAMEDRMLFYWARMFQHLGRGKPYKDLRRTVCIAMLSYDLFPGIPEYRNCYMVRNTRGGQLLTGKLELHIAELSKWDRVRPTVAHMRDDDQLTKWFAYFSRMTTPEELGEIAMSNALIQKAVEAETRFLADPALVTAYEIAEKAEHDAISRDLYHEMKGRKAGRKEGRNEALSSTARNLLAMKMPQDQIAFATGLSLSEIAAIATKES